MIEVNDTFVMRSFDITLCTHDSISSLLFVNINLQVGNQSFE